MLGYPAFQRRWESPRPVDLCICTNGLVKFILLPTCNVVRRNPCPKAHPRAYTIARFSSLLSVVAVTLCYTQRNSSHISKEIKIAHSDLSEFHVRASSAYLDPNIPVDHGIHRP